MLVRIIINGLQLLQNLRAGLTLIVVCGKVYKSDNNER